MTSDRLNIPVGTALTLEAKEENACYIVNLIGYLPGASLLVSAPDGQHILKPGDPIVVRYIHDDSIVGFTSQLLQCNDAPYPYWHLTYPQGVQGRILRRALRYPYTAPVFAAPGSGDGQSVVMADLSMKGARLKMREPLGHVGEAFVLELSNPQGHGLKLPCHIRHVLTRPEGGCEMGVEFDDLPLEAHHYIEALIRHSTASTRTVNE